MRPRFSLLLARIRAEHLCRELFQLAFALAVVVMLAGQTAALGGDIFRTAPASGSTNSTATGAGGTAAAPLGSTIDTAVLLQQRAVAAINRTDTAIRAVNAAQQAARAAAAAAASSVPNGLQAGGLEPLDLSAMDKWKGALAPTTATGKPNDVTIVQNEQNALLTWKTFNIGKDTTLTFDQSKGGASTGQWVAFNHVQDPTASPTQILGRLQTSGAGAADAQGNKPVGGQVFVLNPNGILFGGASQVNVHALVASTLPINENLVTQGLLANPNNEFLFSATELDRKGRGVVERTYRDVTVEAGAQLTAPTNADHNGGRIALFGANVSNAGTISTPDGQTILAAGWQIGLDAHAPNDPTVRGLDVFVGAAAPGAGVASNSGLIEVHRGNATITGRTVDQLGAIDATTSVAYNGSVILDASYGAKSNYNERGDAPAPSNAAKFIPTQTGTVTLGAGSATRVRPEWESTEKVVGSALALGSKVNLRGLNIHFGQDASLWAPGAVVALDAGRWQADDIDLGITSGAQFIYEDAPGDPAAPRTGGQIYLDSGALIDVSGTTAVQASVSDNVIKVELRGAEFANSPVQRDGQLRGETVYVDIRKTGKREDGSTWIGTPLADVTGYANLIQRSIGQLTTKGGSVAMNAGGAVVIQRGASVDVSGGYTNYTAGEVRTTRIVDGDLIIDISKATPERKYDGIFSGQTTTTDPKWGTTKTNGGSVAESFLEAGYTEGAAGGSLAITAPVMALDGSLRGQTVTGARQRSLRPEAGKLELNLRSQLLVASNEYSATPFWHALTAPDIVFRGATTLPAVADFALEADGHARAVGAERVATLELAPALFGAAGFGTLSIENTQGVLTLPVGETLSGMAGGGLTLSGANVSVLGTVRAPGGRLTFNAYNYSPISELFLGVPPDSPAVVPDRGVFTLGTGARLDTAGLLVDDRTPAGLVQPLATGGGAVTIKGHAVVLEQGSAVDVSGGVVESAVGKLTYGAGGAIAIEAGQDLTFSNLVEGRLVAKAALSGYSGTLGGKLSLKAPSIQIGGTTERASTLLLRPAYFSEGGFSSFALTGIGEWTDTPFAFLPGLKIAPDTIIAPKQRSRFAVVGPVSLAWAEPTTLGDQALRTPVSLAFTASGLSRQLASGDPRTDSFGLLLRGDLVVGAGVSIATDPKGSVAFTGQTVEIGQGVRVSAPGGSITVKGASDSSWLFGDSGRGVARPTVLLADGSLLSTRGAVVKQPKDSRGYEVGTVLAGGSISVAGNIVARQGATLDVRGAAGTVDRLPGYSGQTGTGDSLLAAPNLIPTLEASDGGSIALAGSALLVSEATLLGGAGGSSARGGEVVVSSGQFIAPDDIFSFADALDVTLRVRQGEVGAGVLERFLGTFDAESILPVGGGFVTADRLAAGGFDRIDLRGAVSFEGPVSLAAAGTLAVADGGVVYTDSAVDLSAPYVRMGKPFWEPQLPGMLNPHVSYIPGTNDFFYFAPTHGSGKLTVRATELIDSGDLSLQNTGWLNLLVGSGEVRGNGTLDVAGSIYVQAGQVYPTTGSEFTIAAHDYTVDTGAEEAGDEPEALPGTITLVQGANRALPISAGGTLNLYAGHLFQGGTLRAPIGTINLGWDGTGTAPKGNLTNSAQPVARLTNLSTGSTTSVSAVDPITGKGLTLPYGVILNGISWIDPRGIDITTSGMPEKRVNVSAEVIEHETGATVDLRGGGDLYAYRWVSGNGGRTDILASTTSYAVIPSYNAEFAPYAPYSSLAPDTLAADRGYTNGSLRVGDRIHLEASAALPAGEYTLLPARYALLSGAVVVTPRAGVPPEAALVSPEGASLVSGYRFNSLDSSRTGAPLRVAYEVAPQKVVEARAQYDDYSANTFFAEKAAARDAEVPRLPVDAGQLVLAATERMQLRGLVSAQGAAKGRNGLVDLAAPGKILIAGNGAAAPIGNALLLSVADLNTFGAESLLIGGIRRTTDEGTAVTVTADSVTLDNVGTALAGTDIALVANERIELASGSELRSTGTLAETAPLVFGDADLAGSGNGVLVRVSADAQASSVRHGIAVPVATEVEGTDEVIPAVTPTLVVRAGAILDGASGTLDSSQETQLHPTAQLGTDSLALSSGRIGLVLDEAGEVEADGSLLLAGAALAILQQASGTLSLQGYSSIDLFGHGQVGAIDAAGRPVVAGLELHTAEIRGFNTGENMVTLAARDVRLDNVARGAAGTAAATGQGTLVVKSDTLRLGAGELAENRAVAVNGFASVEVAATKAIVGTEVGGLLVAGDLTLRTPLLTASTAADVAVVATGDLEVGSAGVAGAAADTGLGARIALTGATVSTTGTIRLPSGRISIRATDGDLEVGGRLEVAGTAKTFVDVVKYTDAGTISLRSDAGSVVLTKDSVVSVAAAPSGGDAGTLSILAPKGVLGLPIQERAALGAEGDAPAATALAGVLLGAAGASGSGGTFNFDVGSTTRESFAALQTALNDGGFTEARSARVRTGAIEISGEAKAHAFKVAADGGDLMVTGKIDASGTRGGSIDLLASGSVVLADGAELTVAAQEFDAAGKGGRVSLEAGAYVAGVSDPAGEVAIRRGSTIDLSVAAEPAKMEDLDGNEIDLGQRRGTLHLRAPQIGAGTEVQVAPIDGTITGASSIVVEAYKVFDLNPANQAVSKAITTATENAVKANGLALGNQMEAITSRLLANNAGLAAGFHLQPGAEVVNRQGNLTLNHAWSFSGYRFGPTADAAVAGSGEPGTLTLRTSGDLIFDSLYTSSTKKWTLGSLSDGFTGGTAARGGLVDQVLLPEGSRSWSYRLVAGADFSAADFRTVADSAGTKGSIVIGVGSLALPTSGTNNSRYAITGSNNMIPARFQTIRTGTGDIDLVAAYDVRLLNNVATIYTAGQQVAALAGFDVPSLGYFGGLTQSKYGYNQFPSAVQYSMAGGNVSVQAGHDIAHLAETKVGGTTVLVADSSKELPGNWLYRRGLVDPETGRFVTREDTAAGEAMSTTWWIDYSNFYEGVAALGGGNVRLVAGHDIANVDAAVATNARMPGRDGAGAVSKPDASALVELGGGDLMVRAAGDLDGGVYYVERGRGTLAAGDEIRTNLTRSTVLPSEARTKATQESTWLPTTLFLGKGSFALAAGGDLLVGPVANPFLLPSGTNNAFYNRTYFSTSAQENSVSLSSLSGDIVLRNGSVSKRGDLSAWFSNVLAYTADQGAPTYAMTLPWLRLAQINGTFGGRVNVFETAAGLMPAQLRATAFGGDIAINGRLTLMPSAAGHLELAAAGSVEGFQYVNDDTSTGSREWASSSVNLSDADPGRFPDVTTPLGGAGPAPTNREYVGIDTDFMRAFDSLLNETGSGNGSLQDKQALHASDLLHAASDEPVRIYAVDGDITGLTLYSPQETKVIAGHDITDVALYLQNNNPHDVSVVSAGRDIVAFNPNSAARSRAQQPGNRFLANASNASAPAPASGAPTAGDIQVGGPGSLEVLAGRNLDLGIGPGVGDGTGLGLTSIGNARNPALADDGAHLIALAGLGYKWALQGDKVRFTTAVDALLNPTRTGSPAARFLPVLGEWMGLASAADSAVWTAFTALPETEQRLLAGALMDATHLGAANGLAHSALDIDAFTAAFLDPATAGAQAARYLPAVGTKLGLAATGGQEIWSAYSALPEEQQAQVALGVFFTVLRDAGRDYNDNKSPLFRDKKYPNGYAAIGKLFPGHLWQGDIALTSREIKTFGGGDIGLFAPGGQLNVGLEVSGTQPLDQGILTERGGGISIFTHRSVIVGTSRIFTLRGGPEIIWSSTGDIAAGSSSKTVQSAPPTRVLIDPTSADVKTDLSGLATGGGIGVLATRKDVKPDSVDLIAPTGAIDAGDAGIRSSGNLNIAALTIVNAANIATGGSSAGVPATTTPSLGGVAAAASNSAAGSSKTTAAADTSSTTREVMQPRDLPSLIDVVVTGYGGGDKDEDDKEKDGDSDSAQGAPGTDQAAALAVPQG